MTRSLCAATDKVNELEDASDICCSQWRVVKLKPASTKPSGRICWKYDLGARSELIVSFPSRDSWCWLASMVAERLEKSLTGVSLKIKVTDEIEGTDARYFDRSRILEKMVN